MLVLTALSVSRRWKRIIDTELNHLQRAAWHRPDSPGNLYRHDYRIFSFAYAFGHGQTRGPIASCRMPACWRRKIHSWLHLCSAKVGARMVKDTSAGKCAPAYLRSFTRSAMPLPDQPWQPALQEERKQSPLRPESKLRTQTTGRWPTFLCFSLPSKAL